MVEVEDCFEAINKLQRNFHSGVIDKMEQKELLKLAKDWKAQFQYWALSDFKEVVNHVIKTKKYFPKSSVLWAVKYEIINESTGGTKMVFNCGYCKDTGNRAYKDKDGIVHICRCTCESGINHFKHLPTISEVKKQGLSEYKIHDEEEPFSLAPLGEVFRLCREIAGDNNFMLEILDRAEKKSKVPNIARAVKPKMEDEYDELPF
jgi:hypothetical protein